MRRTLKTPVVVDLRNVYDPQHMAEAGLDYTSIGRPPIPARPARETQ